MFHVGQHKPTRARVLECRVAHTSLQGKRKRSAKRSRNRAGRLFYVIARSLARSKDIALGGFYRRMAARRGGLVANIALARKLAALFWRVMVKGMDYVELGLQQYEAKVLETKQRSLRRLARQFGQQLVPMTTSAPTKGPSANNATL
jgi:transposase